MEAPMFLENECALLREAFGWVYYSLFLSFHMYFLNFSILLP